MQDDQSSDYLQQGQKGQAFQAQNSKFNQTMT